MSCCGKQRSALRQGASPQPSAGPRRAATADADFAYTGHGQLSVTGPLTGVVYHFAAHGARVRVHGPDVPSLLYVPGLKPVR